MIQSLRAVVEDRSETDWRGHSEIKKSIVKFKNQNHKFIYKHQKNL